MTPIKAETAHLLTLPEIAACQIIYPPANVGSISEPTKSIRIFGVQEVASWRLLQKTAEEQCKTVKPLVDIPPVQRGLVWDVNQVEIFWDSLMRGFPFGALVFVPKKDGPERFDLFDGQQRCDAIYWGFQPNFDQELTKKDSLSQILWLDLLPGDRLKHSTRRFLARLTTKAHPWGFWRNDNASPLPLSDRRKFLEKMKEVMQKPGHTEVSAAFEAGWRPALSDCVPHDAGFPVPMPVIFQHFDNRTQQIDWKKVAEHPLVGLAEYWKNTTLAQVVADPKHKTDLEKIVKSLGIVANTPVVAICVAPDANDVAGGFEELFVRLN